MSLTKQIVKRMRGIRFEDIPEESLKAARFVILDAVGSAMAGASTEIGKKMISLFSKEEVGPSLIWGSGNFSSLRTACFVNSYLSQILDFDDTYEIKTLAVSHPGPAIVPLSMTMADTLNCKGAELLRAIVLGYEMCMRFSAAIEPRYDDYFGFSNSQIIGAVVASSILLGLNEMEFINALGLAVSTSPVANTKAMWSLDSRPMSWIKDGVGFVATTALTCSQMALAGFKATMEALDPSNKYYKLCGSSDYKTSALTEGLGDDFKIQSISYKPYPTCRFMQSTLDAIENIIVENDISKEDLKKIRVFITPYLMKSFDERKPSTIIDAQFSLPYAVSMVVSRHIPSFKWYEPEMMNSPSTMSIIEKVELVPDHESEKRRSGGGELTMRVEVALKDGSEFHAETGFGKGNPRNPFSREDHVDKFCENLSGYLDKGKSVALAENIMEMDSATKLSSIVFELRSD